ncbi:endonuclease/exonuclease/phosphatase family metal-dependent hydrolase [Stackebrandtia endophytica]|uniref:Endonuclease/exonuclease/phosphatase family metal-dependent hydrolase n=1 Tax=Stackebrandtia endophytica TaxID=1496996 RepID=A0A543B3K0_9ACTN|nr:endonuclease/exonuclease/phosphatase family protein [Stackebrandtia endophytica]TQL79417.1 endonuclease/exonuclease/phosphatase family metal-dependent hydrolase [Stackebrandtia endophytica]
MEKTVSRRAVLTGAIALTAASVGGFGTAHAGQTPQPLENDPPLIGPVDGNRLHAMSFNIRVGVDSGVRAWSARLPSIVTLLNAEQPTILGTQEGRLDQIQDLVDELPDYGCVRMGRDADGTGESCAIFYQTSRLEEVDSGHLWLSETPEVPGSIGWGASYPRIFTWIEFRDLTTDQGFYALNTHFDHRSAEARHQSALLLHDWMQEKSLPCILTGDFNTEPDSEPHQTLVADGRHDTWSHEEQRITPEYGTMNQWNPVPDETTNRIDWIIGTEQFSVHQVGINTWVTPQGNVPSDHWPAQAVLSQ